MRSVKQDPVVSFVTTLSRNVGDDFIREGVKAILDTVLNHYEVAYINKHDACSLSEPLADESRLFNDKFWDADLVVQCGTPVFWYLWSGATPLQSEWYEWLWRDRIFSDRPDRPSFINLGAGSCARWGDDGSTYLSDSRCTGFAASAYRAALLTTVRDPVAAKIMHRLGLQVDELPCPAFLAATRHGRQVRRRSGRPLVAVNLMPGGGHFETDQTLRPEAWRAFATWLVRLIRRGAEIVFIAHDESEASFMRAFAEKSELVICPQDWRDFLELFGRLHIWVGNRVHGAVCASGFGVPAMIFGNDTRAEIGRFIGIPVERAAQPDVEHVQSWLNRLLTSEQDLKLETRRLLRLRERSLGAYVDRVADCLKLSLATRRRRQSLLRLLGGG